MTGLHSPNLTKRSGENVKHPYTQHKGWEEPEHYLNKHIYYHGYTQTQHDGYTLPPNTKYWEKNAQGSTAYCPLLMRQGITSHRHFIKKEENYISLSPTDSLNIKTERVNSWTVKCSGNGLTSSAKHPQVEHQTWLPSYQPNEHVEQHIIRATTKDSAIAVSGGYFKEEWGTSAVIIEVNNNVRHRITAKSTTPGTAKYQDA